MTEAGRGKETPMTTTAKASPHTAYVFKAEMPLCIGK